MLDVTERLVVIIGGGSVAVRKAKGLITAGARRVRCVAPAFDSGLPSEVERVKAEFEPMHLQDAGLAFAATNSPEVNDRVVQEARRQGVLVNRADADEENPGDFTTPALWRASAVTVTVSAGGSAALAARIRDDLARKLDPLQVRLAEAMQVLRPLIVRSGLSPARRREILQDLAGPLAMKPFAEGGVDGLKAWLIGRCPELKEMQDGG